MSWRGDLGCSYERSTYVVGAVIVVWTNIFSRNRVGWCFKEEEGPWPGCRRPDDVVADAGAMLLQVHGGVVGVRGRRLVRRLKAKVLSSTAWWEKAGRRPASRQIVHTQQPDGLVTARVEVVFASRGVRRFPFTGLTLPDVTERGGDGTVAPVHSPNTGTADDGSWAGAELRGRDSALLPLLMFARTLALRW